MPKPISQREKKFKEIYRLTKEFWLNEWVVSMHEIREYANTVMKNMRMSYSSRSDFLDIVELATISDQDYQELKRLLDEWRRVGQKKLTDKNVEQISKDSRNPPLLDNSINGTPQFKNRVSIFEKGIENSEHEIKSESKIHYNNVQEQSNLSHIYPSEIRYNTSGESEDNLLEEPSNNCPHNGQKTSDR